MLKRCYPLAAYLSGLLFLVFLVACINNQPEQTTSSAGQTSQSSLVGIWTGKCNLGAISFKQAEFRDDGTLVLDNNVGKYSANGDRVQITILNYTFEYSSSISQSGNMLILSDSSRNFCSVGRAGTNATQETAQSLMGVWAGQSCQNMFYESSFSKVEFKSDGTMVFDGNANNAQPYSVPNVGSIVFPNIRFGDGSPHTWSFLVSGSTLTVVEQLITGPVTCSFQKSA